MITISVSDRLKRSIAFYCAVALFIVFLPIILAYALGYKIDYSEFKIYKTGILYIESHPAGASIFINDRKMPDVTPARIEELKPGIYRVAVKREGFYPWERELEARPNMVTRADRIVLFPVKQEMKKMGERGVLDFVISDNGYMYYLKKSGLYRSYMDGTSMRRLSSYSAWPDRIIGKRFSPSGDSFLYFDENKVWLAAPDDPRSAERTGEFMKVDEVFSGTDRISDVFWYPGAGYIIIATDKDIKVAELSAAAAHNVVPLYKFNSSPRGLWFDESSGSLYFTDTGLGQDLSESRYLYRIEFKEKFFDQLIKRLLKKEPENGYEKRQIL
jgi:hypothetical protein